MKGIILAGGAGTRLLPATLLMNKHLLPVYDKPMIYYSLSVLMTADIRNIMIISSPDQLRHYRSLFDTGSALGLSIEYAEQRRPAGPAEAFIIGADFIGSNRVALILGDNIIFGAQLNRLLARAASRERGATVFVCRVDDPHRFGVIELSADGSVLSLEEKPAVARSDCAVTGLYFYDNRAVGIARRLVPSVRGELEMTDLNRWYLEAGDLHVEQMGGGCVWIDAGTHDSLLEAGELVRLHQRREGTQIACLEEIALRKGWITAEEGRLRGHMFGKTAYGRAILDAARGR